MAQKSQNANLILKTPMEERTAAVLTPYAFKLVQDQMSKSLAYAVAVVEDTCVVRHHEAAVGSRGRVVRGTGNDLRCSCRLFEFASVVCCHIIRVLARQNIF